MIKFILDISTTFESHVILDYFAGSGTTGHAVINLNREDGGNRKYILVEMGEHFDTVLKPRIEKVVFSPDWKDGKPLMVEKKLKRGEVAEETKSMTHAFKYIRLESYEDTLNNLVLESNDAYTLTPELAHDYLLRYMLDVESQGSNSLLNIGAFAQPFNYTLKLKKPKSETYENRPIDLMETFNYLLGLRVNKLYAPQAYTGTFERRPDPELPEDTHTKLTLQGRLSKVDESPWMFRKVEGTLPKKRFDPNNGEIERVLIIWRTLTDDLEKDNAMLDEYLLRECLNTKDNEYDTIYVNGSNNLPNLRRDEETWKVRLIEETFTTLMWENT